MANTPKGAVLPLCHEIMRDGGSCQEHRGIMFCIRPLTLPNDRWTPHQWPLWSAECIFIDSLDYVPPTTITIEHLRQVCKEILESYEILLRAIEDYIDDNDGVFTRTSVTADGVIEIHKMVLGIDRGAIVTIGPMEKLEKRATLSLLK